MDVVNLMVNRVAVTVGNETQEYPTVSAAGMALHGILRIKQGMVDKSLFPGLIPTQALVQISLDNNVLISLKDGRITVSIDGEKGRPIPQEEDGRYCFDRYLGLVVFLPPELKRHTDYQHCLLSPRGRNTLVKVFLLDYSQIENPTRFLEKILAEVSKFIESAPSVPVS